MRRALVLALVLAVLAVVSSLAVLLWRERLALFVLPAALRDVDAVLRRDAPQDEFDAAALRLLRLQEPGLDARGPCAVVPLRARGGGTLRVVCFQVSDAAREESPDDAERETVFRHRLVDERGRRIDDVLGLDARHGPTVAHYVEDGGAFDILRLVDTDPRGHHDALFSVDRRGFVPHGWALPEALDWMPFAVSSDEESVFDRTLVERLLASDTADVLRALWLIETTDHDVPELRGLLDHTDPLVRARALRLVWQGVQVISQEAVSPDCRRYRALVGDLDPRVRLQAFWALLDHCNDWEAALDALKEDPNAAVAELAHWRAIICSEFDENREPSCEAALWLLRRRSRFAVDTHAHDIWGLSFNDNLSSPAIADAMLDWLEDDLAKAIAGDESAWLAGKLEYQIGNLRAGDLRPHLPRLMALYETLASKARRQELAGLGRALLELADEGADALLLPLLRGDLADALWGNSYVGDALLVRDLPVTALFPDLWRLDRELEAESSADENGWPPSRALWLLAKWNAPGARDALARRLRERCDSSFVYYDFSRADATQGGFSRRHRVAARSSITMCRSTTSSATSSRQSSRRRASRSCARSPRPSRAIPRKRSSGSEAETEPRRRRAARLPIIPTPTKKPAYAVRKRANSGGHRGS